VAGSDPVNLIFHWRAQNTNRTLPVLLVRVMASIKSRSLCGMRSEKCHRRKKVSSQPVDADAVFRERGVRGKISEKCRDSVGEGLCGRYWEEWPEYFPGILWIWARALSQE